MKPCTLCGKIMPAGTVPYLFRGRSEEFCSRDCIDRAEEKIGKGKKMKSPTEGFGSAGPFRFSCDNPDCRKPLGVLPDGSAVLAWPGREGTYCSNTCLKKIEESEGNEMSETNETNAVPVEQKPIIAAGKAKKGKAKKVVTKKVAKTAKSVPTPAKGTKAAPTPKGGAKTAGTKAKDIALTMLRKGATIAELAKATGWNEDSVRWNISQTFRKRMGLNVVRTGGGTYRIAR